MSTSTMYVQPALGRVVLDPAHGDDLPAQGRTVPRNLYWNRAKHVGDVLEMPAPTRAPKTADKGATQPATPVQPKHAPAKSAPLKEADHGGV